MTFELYCEENRLLPMEMAVVLASKGAALQHIEYCAAANVLPDNAVAEQQTLMKWQQSQHACSLMSVVSSHAYMSQAVQHADQS